MEMFATGGIASAVRRGWILGGILSSGKDESLEEKCRNVARERDVYVYSNANKNECVTFAGMARQGGGDYVDIRAHGDGRGMDMSLRRNGNRKFTQVPDEILGMADPGEKRVCGFWGLVPA